MPHTHVLGGLGSLAHPAAHMGRSGWIERVSSGGRRQRRQQQWQRPRLGRNIGAHHHSIAMCTHARMCSPTPASRPADGSTHRCSIISLLPNSTPLSMLPCRGRIKAGPCCPVSWAQRARLGRDLPGGSRSAQGVQHTAGAAAFKAHSAAAAAHHCTAQRSTERRGAAPGRQTGCRRAGCPPSCRRCGTER